MSLIPKGYFSKKANSVWNVIFEFLKGRSVFINVVALSCLLYLFFFLFVIVHKVTITENVSYIPCLTEDCLKTFVSLFPNLLALTDWFLSALAVILAAFGLVVSWKSFNESKKNSVFNNHISNLRYFEDFLQKQLNLRRCIDPKSFDIYKFYKFIFPESINGVFSTSEQYASATRSLKMYLINQSNGAKRSKSFDYRNHQSKLIKQFEKFGITLISLDKADFFKVEDEVISLIDSVTKTFTALSMQYYLTSVDRHYK